MSSAVTGIMAASSLGASSGGRPQKAVPGISTARLAILPGVTHYNMAASPALVSTVTAFLDAPMPGGPT